MIMANQKVSETISLLALVTLMLLSSSVSSFSIPRVTRTKDAIIIDFAGGVLERKNNELEIDNYNPAVGLVPNPLMYLQEQRSTIQNGWSYFFRYPSFTPATELLSGAGLPSEEVVKQVTTTTTTTTTPAPAIQCGHGPTTFPTTRNSQQSMSLISERFTGGSQASKNKWPFMVFVSSTPFMSANPYCSGVLISDTKVLMAAQCLERFPSIFMSYMTVSVGINKLIPLDAQMTRRVTKIVLHSHYNAGTYENDIAIITVDTPFIFSRTVGPVCLPAQSSDPDQNIDQDAIIMGWETDSTYTLMDAKVTIMSNNDCRALQDIGKYVTNTTTCVNSDAAFTCIYDIGGPVVVMSSPGIWTLVAINSYTPKNEQPLMVPPPTEQGERQFQTQSCTSSGLKTRVSAFRIWIDQNMN